MFIVFILSVPVTLVPLTAEALREGGREACSVSTPSESLISSENVMKDPKNALVREEAALNSLQGKVTPQNTQSGNNATTNQLQNVDGAMQGDLSGRERRETRQL